MSGPRPPATDDAMLRTSLRILAAYLVLTAALIVRWSLGTRSWLPLVAHAAAAAMALVLAEWPARFPRWLRDWAPLALGPFLYFELRWLIAGAGQPHADVMVAGWESIVFPSSPAQSLATRWPWLPLSELLHLCYLSYYALIYVPTALLWLRGDRRAFAATVLALCTVYATCFALYIVFPVDGPRFLSGPSAAPEGPVRAFVLSVLESGSTRGTAFPSSHVAAALVAAICALRFQRKTGWLVLGLAIGVGVGAVYGGYHYAIDVVAGTGVGVAAAAVAYQFERLSSQPGINAFDTDMNGVNGTERTTQN